MSYAQYPEDTLPGPSENYSVVNRNSVIRTDGLSEETGFPVQRERFKSNYRDINLEFRYDEIEFGVFQAWLSAEVADGNAWFLLELTIDGETQQYKVRIQNGTYSAVFTNELWTVQFTVEVEMNYAIAA